MDTDFNMVVNQTDFAEELGDIPIYDDFTQVTKACPEMNDIPGLTDVATPTPAPATPRKERSDKERHSDRPPKDASSSKDKEHKSSSEKKTDKDRKERTTERTDRKDDKDRKSSKDTTDSHKRHRDSKDNAETPSKKSRHDDSTSSKSKSTDTPSKERRSSISSDIEGDFVSMIKGKIEESTDKAMGDFRSIIAEYKRNEYLAKICSALGSASDMEKLEISRKEVVQHLRSLADKYESD